MTTAKRPGKPAETGVVAGVRAANHAEILELVRKKLAKTSNRSQIARELGMSRRNLYRYLVELGATKVETLLVPDEDEKTGFSSTVKRRPKSKKAKPST